MKYPRSRGKARLSAGAFDKSDHYKRCVVPQDQLDRMNARVGPGGVVYHGQP